MSAYKHLKNTALVLLALVVAACSNSGARLLSIADLEGSRVAVLDNAVSDNDFNKLLPGSSAKHFKSASEFLLALSIGKCDAGIVEKQEGRFLLNKRDDYASLSYAETDSTLVLVHKSLLPGQRNIAHNENFIGHSINRIHRSIIKDGYWKLILKGFATTITMFLLGIVLAFALAILMVWMNNHKHLHYISKPLSYFIRTIHDVPSIVLIFFFYYFVFASVHISGFVVCSISW